MCTFHFVRDHNAQDNNDARQGCETLQKLAQMMFKAEADGVLTAQDRKEAMKEAGNVRKAFMANKALVDQQAVDRAFDIYRDLDFQG